jgi:hypothetical protein
LPDFFFPLSWNQVSTTLIRLIRNEAGALGQPPLLSVPISERAGVRLGSFGLFGSRGFLERIILAWIRPTIILAEEQECGLGRRRGGQGTPKRIFAKQSQNVF